MSGPSRGLQDWAAEHVPADSPKRKERYVLGDINVSLIKTARGRTIVVEHCTNLPRPYSRIHMVAGHEGALPGLSEPRLHRRARQGGSVADGRGAPRRVRASAVEGARRARAGCRPRRHGLHRGLPPDQVPARRHADRHERLRRGVAQRGGRAERAFERASAARRSTFPTSPRGALEDEPAARHRPHVSGGSAWNAHAAGVGPRARAGQPHARGRSGRRAERRPAARGGRRAQGADADRAAGRFSTTCSARSPMPGFTDGRPRRRARRQSRFASTTPPRRPGACALDFVVQPNARWARPTPSCAAEPWAGGEPFLALNADNLYPVEALRALRALDEPGLPVFERDELVASSNIPPERVQSLCAARGRRDRHLTRIVEKPSAAEMPPAGAADAGQHELLAVRRAHLRRLPRRRALAARRARAAPGRHARDHARRAVPGDAGARPGARSVAPRATPSTWRARLARLGRCDHDRAEHLAARLVDAGTRSREADARRPSRCSSACSMSLAAASIGARPRRRPGGCPGGSRSSARTPTTPAGGRWCAPCRAGSRSSPPRADGAITMVDAGHAGDRRCAGRRAGSPTVDFAAGGTTSRSTAAPAGAQLPGAAARRGHRLRQRSAARRRHEQLERARRRRVATALIRCRAGFATATSGTRTSTGRWTRPAISRASRTAGRSARCRATPASARTAAARTTRRLLARRSGAALQRVRVRAAAPARHRARAALVGRWSSPRAGSDRTRPAPSATPTIGCPRARGAAGVVDVAHARRGPRWRARWRVIRARRQLRRTSRAGDAGWSAARLRDRLTHFAREDARVGRLGALRGADSHALARLAAESQDDAEILRESGSRNVALAQRPARPAPSPPAALGRASAAVSGRWWTCDPGGFAGRWLAAYRAVPGGGRARGGVRGQPGTTGDADRLTDGQ